MLPDDSRPAGLLAALLLLLIIGFTFSANAMAQDVVGFSGTGAELIAAQPPPDTYTVQAGDTLWDISNKFLGNPYYWPRLWSINDYITNPHWIYPGNRIVFTPGTEIEPPGISLEGEQEDIREGYLSESPLFTETELQCGLDMRFQSTRSSMVYRAPALMEDSESLQRQGKVYKARSGHLYLGKWTIVYLTLKDPEAVACGDVFGIYRRLKRRIKHPEESVHYGALYRVVGEAQVLHVQDDVAMAFLRNAFFEVERGDLVGPRIPVETELEVKSPRGSLDGMIVARLGFDEFKLSAIGETVFLDRGRSDGVRVGNTFYVVERRDDAMDLKREDPSLPPSVIGRVVVVRVDETSSTAVVVDASRVINVGSRVIMNPE